jgi:hypothetical protein
LKTEAVINALSVIATAAAALTKAVKEIADTLENEVTPEVLAALRSESKDKLKTALAALDDI